MIDPIVIAIAAVIVVWTTFRRKPGVSDKQLKEYKDAKRFADMAVHKIERGELRGVNADGSRVRGAKP